MLLAEVPQMSRSGAVTGSVTRDHAAASSTRAVNTGDTIAPTDARAVCTGSGPSVQRVCATPPATVVLGELTVPLPLRTVQVTEIPSMPLPYWSAARTCGAVVVAGNRTSWSVLLSA